MSGAVAEPNQDKLICVIDLSHHRVHVFSRHPPDGGGADSCLHLSVGVHSISASEGAPSLPKSKPPRPRPETSASRFMADFVGGALPLPPSGCTTEQLYRAFRAWCVTHGGSYPPSQMAFSKSAGESSRGALECRGVRLDAEFALRRWHRVWLQPCTEPPSGVSRGRWAREGIESFEQPLLEFISSTTEALPHA